MCRSKFPFTIPGLPKEGPGSRHPAKKNAYPAIPPKKSLIPHPAKIAHPAIPPKKIANPAIPPKKMAYPAIPPTPSGAPYQVDLEILG